MASTSRASPPRSSPAAAIERNRSTYHDEWPGFCSVRAIHRLSDTARRSLAAGDAGCVPGDGLRTRHVVVPAGDESLGEEPTARLQVGHEVPTAEGVGGEVADGVEQAEPVLGGELGVG